MRTPLTFLIALSAAACSTPDSGRTSDVGPSPSQAPQRAAAEASAAGAASSVSLDAVRALLKEGRAREALAELDSIHASHPADRAAWLLRVRACLDVAVNDTQPQFYYEDVLASVAKAQALARDPELDLEAARAARMLLRPEQALEFVARAEKDLGSLSPAQERLLIEIEFDRYIAAKQAGAEQAGELAAQLEERLLSRLAAAPSDAWALGQLANLFQWEQRDSAAADVLGSLVRAAPDDENAHRRFVQALRAVEGSESVAAYYEALASSASASPLTLWFYASELFELALADLAAKTDAVERFVRAEEQFVACRSAEPKYEASCKGFEVMCRAGVGWSLFNAGDDAGAERAFLATAEVLEGGIEYRLEGRLASGFVGLEYLADRALRSAKDEFDYEAAGRAARIGAKMRELRPKDAEVANNVGFFHREWGVPMLMHARELRGEAAQQQEERARTELQARAARLESEARAVIAACCDAYKACADLAPDNVRWVNSYALMLVYHYPSRIEEAERLLQHCVSVGSQQMADEARSAQERELITEGVGDANQNLGMIELVHRKDPIKALMYFQRSFDLGPRPRIDRRWVEEVAMHWAREAAEGKPVDLVALDPRLYLLE